MRLQFCTILFLFFQVHLLAQHIDLSDRRNDLITINGIFRFPSFTEGTIVMRSGVISPQRLNYNISTDEMYSINQQGDTVAIPDPQAISFISLGSSRFYYDKGYLQTISVTSTIILAFRQALTGTLERIIGGDDKSKKPVKNDDFFTGNGQQFRSGSDEPVAVTADEHYFFGDADGHFSKAGKDFIFQHFEKHLAEIKSFIKTNHTNFNRLEDLLMITQYCSHLDH